MAVAEAVGDVDAPVSKKAKLFAPPTIEEISDLRESEGLYSGRLSQLKIDEILKEISLNQSEIKEIKNLIQLLTEDLKGLKPQDEFDLSEAPVKIQEIKIPIAMSPPSVKGKMKFYKPKSVKLIKIEESIRYGDRISVNVEIEMPRDCLQDKDHWDERYFRKRAIYLAYLATVLTERFEVQFQIKNGARIKPEMKLSTGKFDLICHLVVESDFCKRSKFSPDRSNMHFDWWSQKDDRNYTPPPTPLYNALMFQDLVGTSSESERLKELFGTLPPSISDGSKLFSLWLRQSCLEFFVEISGIFESVCLFLLSGKRLPRLSSPLQMFRLVLESIAAGDLTSQVCSVDPSLTPEWPVPALVTSLGVNLLATVPPTAVEWLKHSAERDLATLSTDLSSGLISILVKKRSINSFIDHHVTFPHDHELKSVLERSRQFTEIAAVSGDTAPIAVEYLGKVVRTALRDRVTVISPRLVKYENWKTNQNPPKCENVKNVGFGVILTNFESTNNSKIIRGSPADSPKAPQFRSLWGDQTEERRFKDGSICVAAHFDSEDPTRDAIRHLMKFHGEISNVEYFGEVNEQVLKSNIAQFKALSDTYSELEQALRSPDLDVPLKIMQCWPVSPSFRGTSLTSFDPVAVHLPKSADQHNVDVPEAKSLPPHFAANLVLLQLEGSSKWPQNIQAIRKLRVAYHIRLAEILQNKFKMKTAIGESGFSIICRFQGFIFTLKTVYHREHELMTEIIDPKTKMLQIRPNAKSEAEELKTQIRPKLGILLSRLSTIEMAVCRLFRKWIGSHLMSFQIDPLVSDLLVYSALRHDSSGPTGSVRNGFYRILLFFANFDFLADPVFITAGRGEDTNEEFSEKSQNEIREYFQENRKNIFQKYGMFISSAADQRRSLITQNGPSMGVVKKLQALAKASYLKMEKDMDSSCPSELCDLFVTSTKWFDVLIRIKQFRLAKEKTSDQTKSGKHRIEVSDWSIIRALVEKYEIAFGHVAIFFANENDGKVIGVKFKPVKAELKGIQAECFGGMGKDDGNNLFLNKVGILNDLKIIGDGIVESISVQKDI